MESTNPRLVRAVVDESGKTIAWLQEEGIEFVDATINLPQAPRTYHYLKGHGAALVKTLAMRAKEKGVEIRSGTPVKRLLKKGNRIVGVVVEQDGDEVEVAASAVIIGSDGYANKKEWIKKYTGFDFDREFAAAVAHDSTEVCMGDSIEALAEKMGVEPAVLSATVDEYNMSCEKRS